MPKLIIVDKKELVMGLAHDQTPGLLFDTLTITNVSAGTVSFKMKTNNFRRYVVRPNSGTIDAGSLIKLEIMMKSSSIRSLMEMPTKDKFLLLTAPCASGSQFSNEDFKGKQSSRTRISVRADQNDGSKASPEKQVRIKSTSDNPIAAIDKQELTLRPLAQSEDTVLQDTVQIFNKSSCDIAFKVMTTAVVNRRQFGVQPTAGTVKPGASESVRFTMCLRTDFQIPGPNEVRFRILTAMTSPESRKLSKTFWSSAKKSQSMWSFDLATGVADVGRNGEVQGLGASTPNSDNIKTANEWEGSGTHHMRTGFRSGIFRKKTTAPVENGNTNDDLLFHYEQSLSTSETQQQVTLFSSDSPLDTSNMLTSEITAQGAFASSDIMPTDPYSLLLDDLRVNRLMDQVKKLENRIKDQDMEMSRLQQRLESRQVRKSDASAPCNIFSRKFWRFFSR